MHYEAVDNRRLAEFCVAGRAAALTEIERIVERWGSDASEHYRLMLDYPMRPAKGLRPSLCLAVARALGIREAAVIRSAAVLELLHNAFLIHDDVEDQSLLRRGADTLQRAHGVPMAINVGDGMLALSLRPLLENTEVVGLGPALEILETIADTVRITVEGQARELGWIRDNRWYFADSGFQVEYEDLVLRKTAYYSFVAPVAVACIAARAAPERRATLEHFARHLGIAFQIADDLLNLREDVGAYGKEAYGDLWEGKRTLILLHALDSEGGSAEGQRAREALARPRPSESVHDRAPATWHARLADLEKAGHIDAFARACLASSSPPVVKDSGDIELLKTLIERHGSVPYAIKIAAGHTARARDALRELEPFLNPGEATDFLRALIPYVVERLQ